jgi:hypothetical protein
MSPVLDAEHTIHQYCIRGVHNRCAAQLTLTLGGHLGQDVAFVGMFMLVPSRCFFDALGCAAMNLVFRHVTSLLSVN